MTDERVELSELDKVLIRLAKTVMRYDTMIHSLSTQLIRSFRDKWLRDFFLEDKFSKRIPADIETQLFRKLQLIDDATCELDLYSPLGNHFEKPRGHLTGNNSVRIDKRWRLILKWSEEHGDARNIYLDNHDYR